MRFHLKPLGEQVIVVTGASSGIGLVTARMAALHGARLVLVARSGDALERLADELGTRGERPLVVVADVGDERAVSGVVDAAIARFGGFDTWVNNAGASAYGRLTDVPTEDHRRIFETNFWGMVYGSLAAARHLRGRGAGSIINVGSVLSDVAVPYQGMYVASKHAVKGFTDALRMELEGDGDPVSVTLVKPTSINTPYIKHAKNYLEQEDSFPPPVYAPETVARAILHAATHRVRDVYVGSAAKAMAMQGHYAPRLFDKFMSAMGLRLQTERRPARPRHENALHQPSDRFMSLEERGDPNVSTREHSFYTAATLRPGMSAALLLGTAALAATGVYATTQRRSHR